jgi:hypothetical protein
MNEAGIDVAVLSLTTPGVQNLDAEVKAARLSRNPAREAGSGGGESKSSRTIRRVDR